MNISSYIKIFLITPIFFLVSCLGEGTEEISEIKSPDGLYVAKVKQLSHSIGSIAVHVSIGKVDQDDSELTEVFYGLGGRPPVVFWDTSYKLFILFCRGNIMQIESTYIDTNWDKYRPRVYVQVITAPQININGRLECDFDPLTGRFSYESDTKIDERSSNQ